MLQRPRIHKHISIWFPLLLHIFTCQRVTSHLCPIYHLRLNSYRSTPQAQDSNLTAWVIYSSGKQELIVTRGLITSFQIHGRYYNIFFFIMKNVFFSSCHEGGTKRKFWVPIRNRTSDLRIPRFDAITTEPQRLHGERGLLGSSYDTRPAYC